MNQEKEFQKNTGFRLLLTKDFDNTWKVGAKPGLKKKRPFETL